MNTTYKEPTLDEIIEFKRAAKSLAKLGRAGLYLYLANNTLHLMAGPSHEGLGTAHPERVRESVLIPRADGGDW